MTWAIRSMLSLTAWSSLRVKAVPAGERLSSSCTPAWRTVERRYVQSYYGHVDTILVHPHQMVRRGDKIATVGTAHGRYFAHLHFEMREFITPFIGPGYREDTSGWLNPTEFIEQHRGAPDDDVGRPALR